MTHREILKLQSIYWVDASKMRKLLSLLPLTSSSLSLCFLRAWLSVCIYLNHLFFFSPLELPLLLFHSFSHTIKAFLHIAICTLGEILNLKTHIRVDIWAILFYFIAISPLPPNTPPPNQANKTTPFKTILFIHLILMKRINYWHYLSVRWFCCSTFSTAIKSLIGRRRIYQQNTSAT